MHRIVSKEGSIVRACVQSILIYGTETWAMKADDLRSLERTEHMMVRWMCARGVLERQKNAVRIYASFLVLIVADVVRRGRLRWFGHLERKSVEDWVSVCVQKVGGGGDERSGQE